MGSCSADVMVRPQRRRRNRLFVTVGAVAGATPGVPARRPNNRLPLRANVSARRARPPICLPTCFKETVPLDPSAPSDTCNGHVLQTRGSHAVCRLAPYPEVSRTAIDTDLALGQGWALRTLIPNRASNPRRNMQISSPETWTTFPTAPAACLSPTHKFSRVVGACLRRLASA